MQKHLEMWMSVNQSLDLLNGVNYEDVHQILSSTIKPVVEWRCAFCEFQMKNIDLFHDAFGVIKCLSSSLSESSKTVPLVANTLAAPVYGNTIVIIQRAEEEKNNI